MSVFVYESNTAGDMTRASTFTSLPADGVKNAVRVEIIGDGNIDPEGAQHHVERALRAFGYTRRGNATAIANEGLRA